MAAGMRSLAATVLMWASFLRPCTAQSEESAYAKLKRGDYTGAIAEFTALLERDPTSAYALESRAVAYDRAGMPQKALADHSQAIALEPKLASAYGNRCLTYVKLNQLDAALADCNLALKLDSRQAGFYLNRAEVHRNRGDYQSAIEDYNRVAEADPARRLTAQLFSATLYSEQGKYDRAVSLFSEVIAAAPNTTIAYLRRGEAYYRQSLYEQALGDYEQVLRVKPDYYPAYLQRILVYNSHDPAKSVEECKSLEGRSLSGDLQPLYHYVCGTAYYVNGDEKNAALQYRTALQLDPRFVEAGVNLAILEYSRGDYDAALRESEAPVGAGSPEVRFLRGLIFLERGDGANAAVELTKAIELGYPDNRLLLYRGEAYGLMGGEDNLKRADEDFDRFIRTARPGDDGLPLAYLRRGLIALATGALQKAEENFSEAIRLEPMNYSAHCGRGIALYLQKRYKEATLNFQKASGLAEAPGAAFLGWGLALLESGTDPREVAARLKASLEPRARLSAEDRARTYLALAAVSIRTGDRKQADAYLALASQADPSLRRCLKILEHDSGDCASLRSGLMLQDTAWSNLATLNRKAQTAPPIVRPRQIIVYRTITLERAIILPHATPRPSVLKSIMNRKIKL